LIRGRGIDYRREASPLFNSPLVFPLQRGRGIDYRREASPLFNSPLVFPLQRGRGTIIEERLRLSLTLLSHLSSWKGEGAILMKEGLTPLLDTR